MIKIWTREAIFATKRRDSSKISYRQSKSKRILNRDRRHLKMGHRYPCWKILVSINTLMSRSHYVKMLIEYSLQKCWLTQQKQVCSCCNRCFLFHSDGRLDFALYKVPLQSDEYECGNTIQSRSRYLCVKIPSSDILEAYYSKYSGRTSLVQRHCTWNPAIYGELCRSNDMPYFRSIQNAS